jgi:pro-apoptotic serine protease NMA111
MTFLLWLSTAAADVPTWEETIEAASSSIVSLRVASNRPFDTESAGVSYATGFIVDAEQGLILTNRHVVEPGPVTAYAVFLNNEELPLKPVYRDPIHDFGIYRFDPAALRYMEPQALPLCADCAKTGVEVRLIGNDAGEKISILPATIARLDRNAPEYGRGKYNDFNTFYIQAAAGSSGGSSGSPVIDQEGRVVALNAGGSRRAASSFFLPLFRIERALQAIQEGGEVSRGTLQSHFTHLPYDEAQRLGLSEESSSQLREAFPGLDGVLAVKKVNPEGAADGKLLPGDILVRLDGDLISDFRFLDERLDASVGGALQLEVERDGKLLPIELIVEDLHGITPSSFVEGCGGIFHTLSYQMARHYSVPTRGVYIASSGYCLSEAQIHRGNVITEIDGTAIQSTEDLWSFLENQPHGTRLQVRYFSLGDNLRLKQGVVLWDSRWFSLEKWTRDDEEGIWTSTESTKDIAPVEPKVATTVHPRWPQRMARKFASSLVTVDYRIPYRVEGVYGMKFRGTGVVLDAEAGIVAVDRDTVPIALGDVSIIFAGDIRVEGRVLWLHPEHNLALVQYDPALIGSTPIQSVKLRDKKVSRGDKLHIVGRNFSHELLTARSRVTDVGLLEVPLGRVPFFRDTNIEVIHFSTEPETVGGVVSDRRGRVVAMWASFVNMSGKEEKYEKYGLPAYVLQESLAQYSEAGLKGLGIEFSTLPLAKARDFGLTDEQALSLARLDPRRRVLQIDRISAISTAQGSLQVGDILLAVNGEAVTSPRIFEEASREDVLEVSVLRRGEALELSLEPMLLTGNGIDRVLQFGGALLHEVPRTVADQRGVELTGVYVAWCSYGAPCARDQLRPTRRIVEVNGEAVEDLDHFAALVSALDPDDAISIRTLDLWNQPAKLALRPDLHYWTTSWIVRDESGIWSNEIW